MVKRCRRSSLLLLLAALLFLVVEFILIFTNKHHVVWNRMQRFAYSNGAVASQKVSDADDCKNHYAHSIDTSKPTALVERQLFHSNVRFVFVVGLAGAGHERFASLVKDSPVEERLKTLQLHPRYVHRLANRLNGESGGLFHVRCPVITDFKSDNMVHVTEQVVQVMQQIGNQIVQADKEGQAKETLATTNSLASSALNPSNYSSSSVVTIPINGWHFSVSGKMSYPDRGGPCQFFNHPSLDLLYQACNQARVDCSHVYIYRDPYSILQATTELPNTSYSLIRNIRIYTSMLETIWTQLATYPSQNEGCLELFDETARNDWKNVIRQMLFNNDEMVEYGSQFNSANPNSDDAFEAHIRNAIPMDEAIATPGDKDATVPSKLDPSMRTLLRLHDKVVSLCHKQYYQNQKLKSQF